MAFLFGKPDEIVAYAKELQPILQAISGGKLKRGESGSGITAIAFLTDLDAAEMHRRLEPLWRREQRLWILELTSWVFLDRSVADWLRKNIQKPEGLKSVHIFAPKIPASYRSVSGST